MQAPPGDPCFWRFMRDYSKYEHEHFHCSQNNLVQQHYYGMDIIINSLGKY